MEAKDVKKEVKCNLCTIQKEGLSVGVKALKRIWHPDFLRRVEIAEILGEIIRNIETYDCLVMEKLLARLKDAKKMCNGWASVVQVRVMMMMLLPELEEFLKNVESHVSK